MIDLSMRLQPSLKQLLTVMLNPRMMQMLNILHMPYVDLLREIDKTAEENVMLEIEKKSGSLLSRAIQIVRDRKVYVDPGYDGVFGIVKIFQDEKEKSEEKKEEKQPTLF